MSYSYKMEFFRISYTMFVFQDTVPQQGSFRFPDSCTSSADCKFLVTYQTSGEDKVVFEISGKNNWAGVGFSDDNEMVNNPS